MKNTYIVDIETDGLIEDVTTIYVVGIYKLGSNEPPYYLTNKEDIINFFSQPDLTIIGHNFINYDAIVLKKLLQIEYTYRVYDTLFLSWYLFPKRLKHSLESWSSDHNVQLKKVQVEDWKSGDISLYAERVIQDVKISTNLFTYLWNNLCELYGDKTSAFNLWGILSEIGYVFAEQYFNPFVLSSSTQKRLDELLKMKEDKEAALAKHMPKIPIYKVKSKPSVMFKKDGTLSSLAIKWYEFLKSNNLDLDTDSVKYIDSYEEPNPSSNEQVKNWLISLGWVPSIYEERVNTKDEVNKVPQIRDKDKNLCRNIIKLIPEYPELKELEDLTVLNHRIGILKGFIRDGINNTLYGDIGGITNTLRVRHKRIVNLPKPDTTYGEYIRCCLEAPEGHVIVGTDIASLENYTRTNLICEYDPSSVTQLLDPEFDSHLDLAVFAGFMTQQEADLYVELKKNKDYNDEYKRLDKIRYNTKTVNYSALYGVGSSTLSKQLGISRNEAQSLIDKYWERNYAVRMACAAAPTKEHNGIKFIYNKIVGIWFELRSEKDAFSSLNQGMGSIIFFNWVRECRKMGDVISLNMHDEIQGICEEGKEKNIHEIREKAMEIVNKKYNLPVSIKIETKYGKNYAETH